MAIVRETRSTTLDIREMPSHIRANAGSAYATFGLAESATLCDSRWLLLKQPPTNRKLSPPSEEYCEVVVEMCCLRYDEVINDSRLLTMAFPEQHTCHSDSPKAA